MGKRKRNRDWEVVEEKWVDPPFGEAGYRKVYRKDTLFKSGVSCALVLGSAAFVFLQPLQKQSKQPSLSNRALEEMANTYLPIEKSAVVNLFLQGIHYYQQNISSILAQEREQPICKFTPSCSEYARQAIEKYGAAQGTLLAARRLLKCSPLSIERGNDPLV